MAEKTIISYQTEGRRIQLVRCVVYTQRNALGYVVRWQIKNNRNVVSSSNDEDVIRVRFANYLRDLILQESVSFIDEQIIPTESNVLEICCAVSGWFATVVLSDGTTRTIRIGKKEKERLCKVLVRDNENYYFRRRL